MSNRVKKFLLAFTLAAGLSTSSAAVAQEAQPYDPILSPDGQPLAVTFHYCTPRGVAFELQIAPKIQRDNRMKTDPAYVQSRIRLFLQTSYKAFQDITHGKSYDDLNGGETPLGEFNKKMRQLSKQARRQYPPKGNKIEFSMDTKARFLNDGQPHRNCGMRI